MPGYNPNHPVNRGREPAGKRWTPFERALAVLAVMVSGWLLVGTFIGAGHSVMEFFR